MRNLIPVQLQLRMWSVMKILYYPRTTSPNNKWFKSEKTILTLQMTSTFKKCLGSRMWKRNQQNVPKRKSNHLKASIISERRKVSTFLESPPRKSSSIFIQLTPMTQSRCNKMWEKFRIFMSFLKYKNRLETPKTKRVSKFICLPALYWVWIKKFKKTNNLLWKKLIHLENKQKTRTLQNLLSSTSIRNLSNSKTIENCPSKIQPGPDSIRKYYLKFLRIVELIR